MYHERTIGSSRSVGGSPVVGSHAGTGAIQRQFCTTDNLLTNGLIDWFYVEKQRSRIRQATKFLERWEDAEWRLRQGRR